MKKGSNFLVCKYVYHFVDGEYCRIGYFGNTMYLSAEYPSIAKVASLSNSFKVRMFVKSSEIVAWIDKHSNVVVRVIDYSIKQSKINF